MEILCLLWMVRNLVHAELQSLVYRTRYSTNSGALCIFCYLSDSLHNFRILLDLCANCERIKF